MSTAENATESQAWETYEREIIEIFVGMARVLGQPKSLGEIYGKLYASDRPLSLDDLVSSLKISKGSASQGLRQLRSFGAIRTVYVAGDRRDHFAAVQELKKLAGGFLRERMEPHLTSGTDRLHQLREIMNNLDPTHHQNAKQQIDKLENWHRRASQILPWVTKFLGDK